jgi:hypothetical protein
MCPDDLCDVTCFCLPMKMRDRPLQHEILRAEWQSRWRLWRSEYALLVGKHFANVFENHLTYTCMLSRYWELHLPVPSSRISYHTLHSVEIVANSCIVRLLRKDFTACQLYCYESTRATTTPILTTSPPCKPNTNTNNTISKASDASATLQPYTSSDPVSLDFGWGEPYKSGCVCASNASDNNHSLSSFAKNGTNHK